MSEPAGEHERTMAFAEIAFGQIKALHQPATPRNYEVWYTYATGYNPSLNQTINETLAKNGTLTDADLEQVYSTYISPTRFTDKIDNVGTRVMDEINQVMAMMDAAVGSASTYTESLTSVTDKLGNSKDREGLRAIVESLVATANEMKQNNHALEAAAQRVEGRNQSAPGKSRGRPHREPDRPADRRSPTASTSTTASPRRLRKPPSAANRCRW